MQMLSHRTFSCIWLLSSIIIIIILRLVQEDKDSQDGARLKLGDGTPFGSPIWVAGTPQVLEPPSFLTSRIYNDGKLALGDETQAQAVQYTGIFLGIKYLPLLNHYYFFFISHQSR